MAATQRAGQQPANTVPWELVQRCGGAAICCACWVCAVLGLSTNHDPRSHTAYLGAGEHSQPPSMPQTHCQHMYDSTCIVQLYMCISPAPSCNATIQCLPVCTKGSQGYAETVVCVARDCLTCIGQMYLTLPDRQQQAQDMQAVRAIREAFHTTQVTCHRPVPRQLPGRLLKVVITNLACMPPASCPLHTRSAILAFQYRVHSHNCTTSPRHACPLQCRRFGRKGRMSRCLFYYQRTSATTTQCSEVYTGWGPNRATW